jgi:dihydroorotate dehydrogenase
VAAEAGGLSGRPLAPVALAVVRFVARETGGRMPIVGVGGIATPDDARRMLDAGASLLQLYTALIYEGPGLPGRLNRALARRM